MWVIMFLTRYILTALKIKTILALFLVLLFASASLAAQEEPRRVLVFYNSRDAQSVSANMVSEGFKTILNYYGLMTDFVDIKERSLLPDKKQMEAYRAIITVFWTWDEAEADRFLPWLEKHFVGERKLIMLGNPAINGKLNQQSADSLRRIYARLGLWHQGYFTKASHRIKYKLLNAQMVEFERKYPIVPPEYQLISVIGKNVKIHLSLVRTDLANSESSVITTGPHGGFALKPYVYWQNRGDYRKQWYINPFLFIREALDIHGLPAPDPTTLNGVRVGFSHVDADGFSGLSKIGRQQTNAEIMRDLIFKKYAFPVTVSVIVAEINPRIAGTRRYFDIARDIFKLDNVEAASHSYTHPFYWDDSYSGKDRYDKQFSYDIRGYKFNDKAELDDSVKYITDHLAPPGKPCRVFHWTGNCQPLERQIARLDALNVLNINGGDTLLDKTDNSYTKVAPLYRKVGRRVQFHIGQANDNILTDGLTGPLYAYRNIITTMERTETPYRLKPVNIYYHFFSAEQPALLQAVSDVYDWALNQELALVFTSRYLEMMQGFISARIYREGAGRFRVENYGHCLTMRLPPDSPAPNMQRSKNVLGYNRLPQGLYISLAPGKSKAMIILESGRERSTLPYLQKANGQVSSFQSAKGVIRLQFDVFGKGNLAIAGLDVVRRYQVQGAATGGQTLSLRSNADGVLLINDAQSGRMEIKKQ